MKVLVIGSGAREHAICAKLKRSPRVKAIFCAPGNPGIAADARILPVKADDIQGLLRAAIDNKIDFTIVGPEAPLSLGVVDLFRANGLKIFGPSKAAAELESSKAFAKEIMNAAGVKTAKHWKFSSLDELQGFLASKEGPIVLKADGLAAGKGVVVCKDRREADNAAKFLFADLKSGAVLAEEFLTGQEVSLIAATDGLRIAVLPLAHDYKRVGEGDSGPNTGGMGSVCPSPRLTAERTTQLVQEVIRPVLAEMERRGKPFSGFLYAGLMVAANGDAYVLEFNTRLGDPETQSILAVLEVDLFELLWALSEGTEPLPEIRSVGAAVCLVLAAEGYPSEPVKGDEIWGIDDALMFPAVKVFHAGTEMRGAKLVTSGGRVLSVVAHAPNLPLARAAAYRAADMIQFRGRLLRRDIAI